MSGMSTVSASPSLPDEHRRKRVRKGTKSCWECKRRKIRCQLSSEDVSVCAGCLARGTTCLSQEYPEEHDGSGGNQIGERLGRVEMLLEKLVSKINEYDEEEKAQKSLHTPESMGGNDVLTPYASNTSSNESAPILSLFDNPVIGRRETSSYLSPSTMPSPQTSGTKTPSCRPTKIERLRQTLTDLLPSQQDTNLVCEASSCWLLIHAFNLSKHKSDPETRGAIVPSTFDVSDIAKKHPTIIARTLLYISVCLQQIPPTFDTKLFHFPTSVESRVDRFISTVQTLITSDDELVSTIEGLECLILQGIFHINGGNPRRAWLSFRRALNIGQLMGLNKKSTSLPGGREMWFQIVQADRYLALLLGLPCGCADDAFGPEENFQNPEIEKDLLFTRKLSHLSGSIIERNQSDNTQTYTATQEIAEKLEQLAKDLPESWWQVPAYIPDDKSTEAAQAFDRLMIQIWYFQLEALLHLPFMLRNERRYDYSKFSCLKASREMVYRYLALRETETKSFCCKVVDFGALTATVTLLLGLLELPQAGESRDVQEQKERDRTLVRTVLTSMEELSRSGGDIVATQCVNVIKTLLSAESPAGPNGGNLRLTIPYFGTINIARPPATPLQGQQFPAMQLPQSQTESVGQQRGAQIWQAPSVPSYNPMGGPVVSFTSSQFPPHMPEQQFEFWDLQEADTMFFDSLLNTDIEGNWIF